MKVANVTGVGIAVFDGGKISYLKAYGQSDTETGLQLTPDSVMPAASMSKAAFATVVMQLVQSGILDLDLPIQRYLPKPLPEYEKYADLQGDDRYKKLTLRILLSHTSGFPNWRWFEDDRKHERQIPAKSAERGGIDYLPRLPRGGAVAGLLARVVGF